MQLLLLVSVIVTVWASRAQGQEVTCDPPRIANSHYSPHRDKYRLGHVITYTCKQGFYHPTRGNTARCTAVGWMPPPRCSFKPCDFPEIKHGHLHNESAHRPNVPVPVGKWLFYYCNENYVTSSERSWDYITCTKDGWSPKVPCRRKCFFDYLENGDSPRYRTKYLQGDSVRVTCHAGYSLRGQQTTMTCTESGWAPPPKCIRVGHCYMPVFENAIAIITGKVFRPNDKLDYQCLDGYENRDGNTTGSMVCGEDGWSHLPTCFNSTEKCGPPPSISNGDITSFPLATYPPGSRVEYQCQDYYELQGPKYANCSHAKWSEPPRCLDPCVISKEIMNENNIRLKGQEDKTHYAKTGDVVEFVCQSGRNAVTSEQSFQAKCQEGTLQFPRCE